MSALLSIQKICLFSLTYECYNALKIGSFWHVQEDGMVPGLPPNLDQTQGSVGIMGRFGEHFEKVCWVDMVGAGAGDQDAAGAKHLQGAEVELFVAAEGGIEGAFTFGEGGWIENDGVIALAGGSVVLEQIEGVGLDPFDVLAIEGGIPVGDLERGPRAVDAGDVRAARGQVKGKASLVAENVEGFAVGVLGSGSVVLALVEEPSGLLAFERVAVELDAVHGEDGRGSFALD